MNQFPPSRFKFFRKFSEIFVTQHRWQIEKIFNQKSFYYFVWTPWVVELKSGEIFFFKFTLRRKQSDIVPITSLLPLSLTPVTNLLTVLLIPVVHLHLWISPRIFEQFEITLMLFSAARGKMLLYKKPEAKNLVILCL
jgi:hypothetical protein